MAELDELRGKIDQIDAQIVELLNQRAEIVIEVKEAKERGNVSIYSSARERQILDRVRELAAKGKFPPDALVRIFSNIVSATRSLMGEMLVSYLGPEGSLGHVAALRQFGEEVRFFPEASADEVMKKVERGDSHYGMLPASFRQGGFVTSSLAPLLRSALSIVAELEVDDSLSLLAVSDDRTLGAIERVYGDASSLEAATKWLGANLPAVELVVVENTAVAVQRAKREKTAAVIGREMSAGLYDLKVLMRGLENEIGSVVRFIVVGSSQSVPSGNDKTSLFCVVEERAGALMGILEPFASRGITLVKIESHPQWGNKLEYAFFIEIEGHREDEKVSQAIAELNALCADVKVLGSYPRICRS